MELQPFSRGDLETTKEGNRAGADCPSSVHHKLSETERVEREKFGGTISLVLPGVGASFVRCGVNDRGRAFMKSEVQENNEKTKREDLSVETSREV